jgi:hypothetical protein
MSGDVNDIEKVEDPTSYKKGIKSTNSSKWPHFLRSHGREAKMYGHK